MYPWNLENVFERVQTYFVWCRSFIRFDVKIRFIRIMHAYETLFLKLNSDKSLSDKTLSH